VSRKPNDNYYPDYSDQEFLWSDETVAMNKETLSKTRSTPFLISSQVAMETKAYEKKIQPKLDSGELQPQYSPSDWHKDYDSGRSYWIPENRWVHETNYKPEQVDENLYSLRVSADVFFLKNTFKYLYTLTGQEFMLPMPMPLSRTLYQHLEVDDEKIKDLNLTKEEIDNMYSKEDKDMLYPYWYLWNIRWLPKNPSKITFFTDEEIEKKLRIKVSEFTIECPEDTKSVQVPVQLYVDVRSRSPYIKHDEIFMYMRVEEL
jgi:hypothetical protein